MLLPNVDDGKGPTEYLKPLYLYIFQWPGYVSLVVIWFFTLTVIDSRHNLIHDILQGSVRPAIKIKGTKIL